VDDHQKHVEMHQDYLYLFFDKPLQGIKMDFGKPIIEELHYGEEEVLVPPPITMNFDL